MINARLHFDFTKGEIPSKLHADTGMKPAFEKSPHRQWESFSCEVEHGSGYNATWHFHPEYQITLVLKSRGYRLVGDKITPLRDGETVMVTAGLIFSIVLGYNGSLNALLKVFGIPSVDWLGRSNTALPVTLIIQSWSTFGFGVLIFLAGLSTVPKDMVEAARLEGAKMWQVWWHVIIPELRPIIEFSLVITTIGLLTSLFGLIYVLTGGGPGTATTVPEYLIWSAQGRLNQPAYAAALSVLLFVVTGALAWLQIRMMSRNANL